MDAVLDLHKELPPDQSVVIDNVRTAQQLDHFRTQRQLEVFHVHLYARTDELERRFSRKREKKPQEVAKYSEADLIKNEADIDRFKDDADVRINTSRTDARDNLVRVAARLGMYSPPDVRCVDVLVGGQYGSEGKGHVAAYLSRYYDVLVRVGGPNAGHTVRSSSGLFTYHHLPSGARDTTALLLLGPGMTIHVTGYVTSRDTNVAGCLAEAGISPSRVRRILMVIRPTPIRVGHPDGDTGDSGPLKHETNFETVAAAAGLNSDEVVSFEKTSTTNRKRRVGWFDWEQFRQACALNAPTDIVLTFADYINGTNQNARRFEQLHEDTIKFIEEIERVAQAPVSLINTRFPRDLGEEIDLRTVIDRRNWTTKRSTSQISSRSSSHSPP